MGQFNMDEAEAYVASAFNYYGEVPFLYRTFEPTDEVEPDLTKERGGYKVVSSFTLILLPTKPIVHRFVMVFSNIK